jgi:hypothetical protein
MRADSNAGARRDRLLVCSFPNCETTVDDARGASDLRIVSGNLYAPVAVGAVITQRCQNRVVDRTKERMNE